MLLFNFFWIKIERNIMTIFLMTNKSIIMKVLKKILIVLILTVFTVTSCTEDLELVPVSQISTSSFWKSENDVAGALNGMYVRFRLTTENQYYWGEMRSGIMQQSIAGIVLSYQYLYKNTLNASAGVPGWGNIYTVVHDANIILENAPTIKFANEATKNNALAQAYAMRAFCYFVMVRTWGGVPLVTQSTNGVSESNQRPRATAAEIFAQIKKDIAEAEKLFSNNNYSTGRALWSKPALNAFKADVYLWTAKKLAGGNADLNTVLTTINEIEASDVTLLSNFSSIFDYNNKGNKEVIFAVRYADKESAMSLPFNSSFIHPQVAPALSQVDPATAIAISGADQAYSYLAVRDHVRNAFSIKDQRRNATIFDLEVYKPTYPNGVKSLVVTIQNKYQGVLISGGRRWFNDYVIYRYGDILLMKAEAKNALGQDPSIEINKVRKRAYGADFNQFAFVNGSKAANDTEILKEKLMETAFEGHYWYDLVRFGKVFDLVPELIGQTGKDHMQLFPIDQNILSKEPKVTQNPGW